MSTTVDWLGVATAAGYPVGPLRWKSSVSIPGHILSAAWFTLPLRPPSGMHCIIMWIAPAIARYRVCGGDGAEHAPKPDGGLRSSPTGGYEITDHAAAHGQP